MLRDPLEICTDRDEAYGERLDFWIHKLRTGPVGKTGLHRRFGIQPRAIHTVTGLAWGLFVSPFDEAGIEYVPDAGEVRNTARIVIRLSPEFRQEQRPGRRVAVAQQVLITMVDDLDGTEEGVETIRFGLDGKEWEIDLSADNNASFRKFMAPYVEAGRPAARASRQAPPSRRQRPAGTPDPIEVRKWAQAQGIKVSERGRVPVSIVRRFQEANA
jgi:hypothetical protein